MRKSKLPDNIKGEWIWGGTDPGKSDHYVFFRREIALASVVTEADLWISAHSSYHLFVNGRHIGFGPPSSTKESNDVELYDLSYYLETGANTIGIVVYSNSLNEISSLSKIPGVWCQLNIEGEPTLWTDCKWLSYSGLCYADTVPLKGLARGYCENVNLSKFPHGWNESGFFDENWKRPDIVRPLTTVQGSFEPSQLPPLNCDQTEPSKPVAKGTYSRNFASTYVSFHTIPAKGRSDGIYAAETYIYSGGVDVDVPVKIKSDNDIKIFVNGEQIFNYNVLEYSIENQPPLFLEGDGKSGATGYAEFPLRKGWNRILAVQNCRYNRAGFFISIPDLTQDDVKFFVAATTDVPEGWMIAGPLKMPYVSATGSLKLEKIRNSLLFTPSFSNLSDPSSFLDTCTFRGAEKASDETIIKEEIKEGEYLIYDMGRIRYGFPLINFEGHEGDIVDVLVSDRLSGDAVPSFGATGRTASPLTLPGGVCSWSPFNPDGTRYIMIVARKAAEPVRVESLSFFRISRYFEETFFESSDETINIIWKSGIRTLKNTVMNTFLDSPSGYQCQFLADSMIQSIATAYSFGNYSVAEKALRDFSHAQYEDGNIPAVCPGSLYLSVIDYVFLWPVWVQKSCQMGDFKKLLGDLIPSIDNLLDFFGEIEDDDTWLISNIGAKSGLKCLIDYAEIDNSGISTAVNSLYCRALLSSADIYDHSDLAEKAANCRLKASTVANNLRNLNWNSPKGLFADSSSDGKLSANCSMQANVLAIFGGVANADEYKKMFSKLFSEKKPFIKPGNVLTPYFSYFIFETFFALGYTNWCVNLMKHYWGEMLEDNPDCMWPFFPKNGVPERQKDLCHGSSVSPNIFIIRELAGIRLAETGFKRIYFNPTFSALKTAKIHFHTTSGRINISWSPNEDGGIEIQIDAGFSLEVAPKMPKKILDKCTFTLGPSITMLETV